MFETHTYPNTTWIQMINPTKENIDSIAETYDLDPQAIRDLSSPTPLQKVETYGNFTYVVFHIPAYRHSHSNSHLQEIDFIIGKDYIITVQYDAIDALLKFSKEAGIKTLLGKDDDDITVGLIFTEVLSALYNSVGDEILYMQDQLRKIEENIFSGHERQMVTDLSKVSRNLLDIKRTLAPQRMHFENLLLISSKSKSKVFSQYVKTIFENSYLKIYEETEHNVNLVAELRETNNSLVSTKQNEVMKILTLMAFITFPLALIASIFGMNTISTPIIGHPQDFWIIFGLMLIATSIMFFFFKFKKWL